MLFELFLDKRVLQLEMLSRKPEKAKRFFQIPGF
jgi:hypothetical protein